MRRKLAVSVFGLSAIGCVFATAIWVQGFRHPISHGFYYHHQHNEVASRNGRLWLDNQPQIDDERRQIDQMFEDWRNKTQELQHIHERARHEVDEYDFDDPHRAEARKKVLRTLDDWSHSVDNPPTPPVGGTVYAARSASALIPIATMSLPAILIASFWGRRRGRRGKGLCITCGYDLRASSDACPECGSPINPERVPGDQ